jgi:hypothetical protein
MKENKLIAEFMGLETITIGRLKSILRQNRENGFIHTPQACIVDELKYDTSWDWLMPVINKCYQEHMSKHIADAVMTCDIDEAYQVVVEFIKNNLKTK